MKVNALKLTDVDKLLKKHFGDKWKDDEELRFYKNVIGDRDKNEEDATLAANNEDVHANVPQEGCEYHDEYDMHV